MNQKPFFIFTIALGMYLGSDAQTCLHSNLSKRYDYKIIAKRHPLTDSINYTADIILQVFRKNKPNVWQSISYKANLLYDDGFKNCDDTRSYATGYRTNADVPDYDFGNLIIADLNFDGLEDIAIKYDSGGNGGPRYNFYLQDKKSHFYLSRYLTDRVGSFPAYIDPKQKTIATQIHANVRYEALKTFGYNPKTKRWKLLKWQMVE